MDGGYACEKGEGHKNGGGGQRLQRRTIVGREKKIKLDSAGQNLNAALARVNFQLWLSIIAVHWLYQRKFFF
jgi:hypothetical protein